MMDGDQADRRPDQVCVPMTYGDDPLSGAGREILSSSGRNRCTESAELSRYELITASHKPIWLIHPSYDA